MTRKDTAVENGAAHSRTCIFLIRQVFQFETIISAPNRAYAARNTLVTKLDIGDICWFLNDNSYFGCDNDGNHSLI